MAANFQEFHSAYAQRSGSLLASTLLPIATPNDPDRLRRFSKAFLGTPNSRSFRSDLSDGIERDVSLSKGELAAWTDVYLAFWRVTNQIVSREDGATENAAELYDTWKALANALIKGYNGGFFEAWTVPCLYVVGRFLRVFAIRADEMQTTTTEIDFSVDLVEDVSIGLSKNERLEDAARVLNRMFTLCISDRAPLTESRRWGLYYCTNLLFKTYFKLNSVGLSKNILRALQASRVDLPPAEAFPKSHIVTFKYYVGVIHFLDENYEKAEENLTESFRLCHRGAQRNRELILTYLIPCRLLTTHCLPSSQLLEPFPRLKRLFAELCHCIKLGDLAGFDRALASGEQEFVKRRIYLTLERGRDIALRNLLRKVFIFGGFEDQKDGSLPVRRSRIPIAEFAAAIRIGNHFNSSSMDHDEVECLLANMIYKNLMKGYISRERSMAVLSKGAAFPGTCL